MLLVFLSSRGRWNNNSRALSSSRPNYNPRCSSVLSLIIFRIISLSQTKLRGQSGGVVSLCRYPPCILFKSGCDKVWRPQLWLLHSQLPRWDLKPTKSVYLQWEWHKSKHHKMHLKDLISYPHIYAQKLFGLRNPLGVQSSSEPYYDPSHHSLLL